MRSSFASQPSTIKNCDQITSMCAKESPFSLARPISSNTSGIFRKCSLPRGEWHCIPEFFLETQCTRFDPSYLKKVDSVAWPGSRGKRVIRENQEHPRIIGRDVAVKIRDIVLNSLAHSAQLLSGMGGYSHVGLTIDVRRSSRPLSRLKED